MFLRMPPPLLSACHQPSEGRRGLKANTDVNTAGENQSSCPDPPFFRDGARENLLRSLIVQLDRLPDAAEGLLKRRRLLLRYDCQVVEHRPIGEERRKDADQFLAAER